MTTVSFIDHTADIGLDIVAPNPEAAFIAAAEGMFEIMVNWRTTPALRVSATRSQPVEARADGWQDLLVTWLEELLFLFETERLVPKTIDLADISSNHVRAIVHNDVLDASMHNGTRQIKAVTYHQLRAEATPRGFEIRVIFDI
jgi:SHS2 domain-containing protein